MKTLLIVLALAFIASASSAQSAEHKTIPIFWQITKPGTHDTSYVLGTYHLASSDRVKKMTRVMQAFNRSKIVVGEMIFDESSIASVLPHLTASKPLNELLPDSDFHYLDTTLQSILPVPLAAAVNFKPIAIYVMASTADALSDDTSGSPFDLGSAMDIYFQSEGKRKHKHVYGLETTEEQAAILFDSIPEQRQAQGLLEYMKDRASSDAASDSVVELYIQGRVDDDLVLEGLEKSERALLLDNRNQRWLAILPKYLKQHAFIAVGAGHLGGPLGLIEGLRKQGYTVQPLPLK